MDVISGGLSNWGLRLIANGRYTAFELFRSRLEAMIVSTLTKSFYKLQSEIDLRKLVAYFNSSSEDLTDWTVKQQDVSSHVWRHCSTSSPISSNRQDQKFFGTDWGPEASWTVVTLDILPSGTLKRRQSGTLHHVMTFILTPREGRTAIHSSRSYSHVVMSFAFDGFRIFGCCSCVSFARDSVGGNSFLVMMDFARVHFYDFLVCKIRVLHELRTSSRGPQIASAWHHDAGQRS